MIVFILVLNAYHEINDFRIEYEKCKETYPNQLIFSYEFEGTKKMIDSICEFIPSNF